MGLREKTTSGIKWNAVATITTILISILQLSILTRLLEKSDFGLIAIASLIISFTGLFSEMGITVALIHKQNISQDEYSSMYWLNVSTNLAMCLITILTAPLVATFYNEPSLVKIITVLAMTYVFNAFGKIFYTIKIKELEFNFISKIRIITALEGFVVTILLAYLGYGVMSLAYGQVFAIGSNQLVFAIAGYKSQTVRFHFSLTEIIPFLKIGGYQFLTQILDFLASRLDVFLIGKFFTMDELGVYNIAKELVLKPYNLLNNITSNVFSSAFAKIQNDLQALRDNFEKLIQTIAIATLPLYAILFIFSDLIVLILYGSAFYEVATFIRILTCVGVFSAISSQGGVVMISLGRTDLGLRWTIARIIMSTIVIVTLSLVGLYAVAYGQTLLEIVSIYVYYCIVIRPMLKLSFTNYLVMFRNITLSIIVITICFAFININYAIPLWGQMMMLATFLLLIYIYIYKCYPFIFCIMKGFIPKCPGGYFSHFRNVTNKF